MANAKQTAVVVQQGDLVTISVYPSFYGKCAARGDVALWPERTCDSLEYMPDTGIRQWTWRFPSTTAAQSFATEATAKIAHWEDVLLGPNPQT